MILAGAQAVAFGVFSETIRWATYGVSPDFGDVGCISVYSSTFLRHVSAFAKDSFGCCSNMYDALGVGSASMALERTTAHNHKSLFFFSPSTLCWTR